MKYQDLVIKDGKFVGEFEKMYQEFDDPWNQTKEGYVENSVSRQIVCNYINQYQINSMVEFGCGLGKTTNFISNKTNINKVYVYGNDIKETYKKLKSRKKGEMLESLDYMKRIFKKNINNNDIIMIKGSNATGLFKISQNLKKGKINVI